MDIAIATPYYPPHIGGVEVHVKNKVDGLKKRGHNVRVLTSTKSNFKEVITVPCLNLPYAPVPLRFPKISAEIYHSHIPSPFFSKKIVELKLKPHIITYHNDVILPKKVYGVCLPKFSRKAIELYNKKIVSKILDSCDLILATTRSYSKSSDILSKFDYKTKILPNGIYVNQYQPKSFAEKENYVIYVGRLVEYKGLPYLFQALKILKDLDYKLIIVGDGEDKARLEKMAQKNGIKARFMGKLPSKDKIYWISKSKVLVLPSTSRLEAFGIVLLEAMACQTPVIAYNAPGVGEIAKIGGYTFEDPIDLANKIEKLLTNNKILRKIGKRGRKEVAKNYDWSVILNELERIYNTLALAV